MELHQLRYFCAVADLASFSRAAEQCHVAQPSLSQQIRKLEEEIGARLFDRLGRSIRLTALGQSFLPRARAVLRELEDAKRDLSDRKEEIAGPVCIGAIPTIAPYLLPPLLAEFSRKAPQAKLTVVEEITPVLLEHVKAGTVDVAVLALPVRGPEFDSFVLRRERLFAVLPKRHPLARRDEITLAALREEPFLLLRDGHCFRDTAVSACEGARFDPQVIFESGQFSSILGLVGSGMGVSLVPEMAVEKRRDCAYVPIADERAFRIIGAVKLRGRTLSRAQRAMIRHLRDSATGAAKGKKDAPAAC